MSLLYLRVCHLYFVGFHCWFKLITSQQFIHNVQSINIADQNTKHNSAGTNGETDILGTHKYNAKMASCL